jgi:hypothetical protein
MFAKSYHLLSELAAALKKETSGTGCRERLKGTLSGIDSHKGFED